MSVDTRKAPALPRIQIAELDDTLVVARPAPLPRRIPTGPGARVAEPVPALLPITGPPRVDLHHAGRPVLRLDQAWPRRQVTGYVQYRCPVCGTPQLVRTARTPQPCCPEPVAGEAA